MLACEGIARLVKGIPRFPCGNAGGIGFWGLRGPLLLFFLCFLVSAGGLVFLRGFRCCCCWCCTRRFPSPRRKLSCAEGKEQIKQVRLRDPPPNLCGNGSFWLIPQFQQCLPLNTELTIFLACSSQRGVWCVISNTGMEHCWPSANLAVQLAKSCWERFNRMSTENS